MLTTQTTTVYHNPPEPDSPIQTKSATSIITKTQHGPQNSNTILQNTTTSATRRHNQQNSKQAKNKRSKRNTVQVGNTAEGGKAKLPNGKSENKKRRGTDAAQKRTIATNQKDKGKDVSIDATQTAAESGKVGLKGEEKRARNGDTEFATRSSSAETILTVEEDLDMAEQTAQMLLDFETDLEEMSTDDLKLLIRNLEQSSSALSTSSSDSVGSSPRRPSLYSSTSPRGNRFTDSKDLKDSAGAESGGSSSGNPNLVARFRKLRERRKSEGAGSPILAVKHPTRRTNDKKDEDSPRSRGSRKRGQSDGAKETRLLALKAIKEEEEKKTVLPYNPVLQVTDARNVKIVRSKSNVSSSGRSSEGSMVSTELDRTNADHNQSESATTQNTTNTPTTSSLSTSLPPSSTINLQLHVDGYIKDENNSNNTGRNSGAKEEPATKEEEGEVRTLLVDSQREWGSLLAEAKTERPPCKYGSKCTQLDPAHWVEYSHFQQEPGEDVDILDEVENKGKAKRSRNSSSLGSMSERIKRQGANFLGKLDELPSPLMMRRIPEDALNAPLFADAIKEGWLYKRKERSMQEVWRKYWFVLRPCQLGYYSKKNKIGGKLKQIKDLNLLLTSLKPVVIVTSDSASTIKHDGYRHLHHHPPSKLVKQKLDTSQCFFTVQTMHKLLYLCALSQEDRDDWMTLMNKEKERMLQEADMFDVSVDNNMASPPISPSSQRRGVTSHSCINNHNNSTSSSHITNNSKDKEKHDHNSTTTTTSPTTTTTTTTTSCTGTSSIKHPQFSALHSTEGQDSFTTELQRQLRMLVEEEPANSKCADCGTKGPEWASINIGVFLCLDCCGVHRGLGTHITQIRSLYLDRWDTEKVEFLRQMGNKYVNGFWEAYLEQNPEAKKKAMQAQISSTSSRLERKDFISFKYGLVDQWLPFIQA